VHNVWKLGIRVDLEGLGHIGVVRNQEMSWKEDVQDVVIFKAHGEPLTPGKKLRLAVKRVEPNNHQIVLSLRRAEWDPWDHQSDHYQVDKPVRGQVTLITKDFALVEFEDHVTGKLPREEIVPWPIKSIDEILFKDDSIEAVVMGRDDALHEISISMKARFEQIAAELGQPGSNEAN
jgi:ribosomal protein S1